MRMWWGYIAVVYFGGIALGGGVGTYIPRTPLEKRRSNEVKIAVETAPLELWPAGVRRIEDGLTPTELRLVRELMPDVVGDVDLATGTRNGAGALVLPDDEDADPCDPPQPAIVRFRHVRRNLLLRVDVRVLTGPGLPELAHDVQGDTLIQPAGVSVTELVQRRLSSSEHAGNIILVRIPDAGDTDTVVISWYVGTVQNQCQSNSNDIAAYPPPPSSSDYVYSSGSGSSGSCSSTANCGFIGDSD